jgi:hypothetical protein
MAERTRKNWPRVSNSPEPQSRVENKLARISLLFCRFLILSSERERERIKPADGGNKSRLIPRERQQTDGTVGKTRENSEREEGGGIGGVGGAEEEEGNGWRKICQEGEGERQGRRVGVVMRGCKGGGRERSLAEFGFIYFSLLSLSSSSVTQSLSLLGLARIPFLPH